MRQLQAYRAILDHLVEIHHGRIFNTAGDSVIADFASAVDAVECAVAVQQAIAEENANRAPEEQMRFRIGVHVGDVIVEGSNLYGDSVNIAARLEALAEPGGVCLSGAVRDQIGNEVAGRLHDARRAASKKHRRAGARFQGRRELWSLVGFGGRHPRMARTTFRYRLLRPSPSSR